MGNGPGASRLPADPDDQCKDETGRCQVCDAPITPRPHALPVCTDRRCRRAWLGPHAAARQREIDASLETVVRAAAQAGTAGEQVGTSIALLPANTRALEPVSSTLRDRFVQSMRARLRDYPPERTVAEPRFEDPVPTDTSEHFVSATLALGCATCRGACCTRGGTHAFLGAAALRDMARRHTNGDTGAPLEALYAEHLPAAHFADSCVFHGERGCTLPRALRSNTCNRYLCGALTSLGRALTAAGSDRAVVGAATWSSLERVAVIERGEARELPL